MNCKIIDMLEAIKFDNYSKAEEHLEVGDIQEILSWYEKYTTAERNCYDIEKAIDLLYALYVRENLVVYPVEEFQRVVGQLADIHSFKKEMIWEILSDFKKIVYGE